MAATCLQICQQTASWLALPVPTAVWSSTDAQVIQLRTLLNEEGDATGGSEEAVKFKKT